MTIRLSARAFGARGCHRVIFTRFAARLGAVLRRRVRRVEQPL